MATTDYAAAIDSNDIEMAYIKEDTWGVTPTGNFQAIRLDSEGFSGSKSRTRPNEIDPAGQASAAITTKEESTGSIGFSVSAGTHNELIAASMGSVFTTAINFTSGAATCDISSGSDVTKTCTLNASDATFTDGADQVLVGQFIKVTGTGSSPYNFIGRVKTVANTALTLDCCSGTVPASKAAAAMGATTIKGSMLRNGTTFQSFSFEKLLSTNPGLYLCYAGSFPNNASLDVGVGDYLKGSLNFLNKSQVSATSSGSTGAYASPPTGTVIDSIKGIGTVWRGVDTGATSGAVAPIAGVVQKLGIKWDREGAAAQYGIGSSAALGVRPGKVVVTGSMSTYFKNFDLYDQYIQEKGGPISFYALDGDVTIAGTKGYVITFCNATIMNPKVVAGGPGQDIMADFEIEGNPDISSPSLFGGKTVQIDYFG